ncbi:hypothetical protein BASA81_000949 [Batrachochytrium salamandrivorans]|nr:hypothetical protein BASA81_000949 [Batrachochytrium salamandrivorans]
MGVAMVVAVVAASNRLEMVRHLQERVSPQSIANAILLPDQFGGIGFFAKESLTSGSLVCDTPHTLLVCYSYQTDEGSPLFSLAFKLLALNQSSLYVQSLPWATCLKSFATWEQVENALELGDEEDLETTREQLDCALYLVQSRLHQFTHGLCLVPLCDMFNRPPDGTLPNVHCGPSPSHSLVCRTTHPVAQHTPLLVTYYGQDKSQWGIPPPPM